MGKGAISLIVTFETAATSPGQLEGLALVTICVRFQRRRPLRRLALWHPALFCETR